MREDEDRGITTLAHEAQHAADHEVEDYSKSWSRTLDDWVGDMANRPPVGTGPFPTRDPEYSRTIASRREALRQREEDGVRYWSEVNAGRTSDEVAEELGLETGWSGKRRTRAEIVSELAQSPMYNGSG